MIWGLALCPLGSPHSLPGEDISLQSDSPGNFKLTLNWLYGVEISSFVPIQVLHLTTVESSIQLSSRIATRRTYSPHCLTGED